MNSDASGAKPRLLFLSERFPPDLGGVARSANRTAHALARLGFDVHVLAWTKTLQAGTLESSSAEAPDPSGEPRSTEITLHRLGLFSNWDMSLQHTMNVLDWLHETHDFAAAWGHYVYPAGFLAVLFAESKGIRSLVSARGNDIDRLMFPPGDFARLEWTLRRASGVTSVSQDLARKIGVLLGDAQRAHVVRNSVDLNLFQAEVDMDDVQRIRNDLAIPRDNAILGFCGELRHKKGLPFLLACLAETNQTRPCRLLIIGAVRPREQTQLSSFLVEHPELEDRIIATGVLDDPVEVARRLHVCDVVLAPSVWEGLPNAVLESMACGRITLASDAGGIPEVISHGEDGFIIPKAQLNRLGEATLEILAQPESVLGPIRAAARQKVETEFGFRTEERALREAMECTGLDTTRSN